MRSSLTPAGEILAPLELFLGLAPEALNEVLVSARIRRLPTECRIFGQDDPAERAYALVEGSVRISQCGSDGAQIVVRFIGPGETFGTIALFTNGRYPADAVTLTDSLEASWSEHELLYLMERHPHIAMNVIRIIGKRLQEVQDRVRELSTQRVEQRIANAVLRLARQAGHATIDGTAIDFPLRRRDVADISGTTLHTTSRILAAWEKAGFLTTDSRHLTVRKPSDILRIAENSTR